MRSPQNMSDLGTLYQDPKNPPHHPKSRRSPKTLGRLKIEITKKDILCEAERVGGTIGINSRDDHSPPTVERADFVYEGNLCPPILAVGGSCHQDADDLDDGGDDGADVDGSNENDDTDGDDDVDDEDNDDPDEDDDDNPEIKRLEFEDKTRKNGYGVTTRLK